MTFRSLIIRILLVYMMMFVTACVSDTSYLYDDATYGTKDTLPVSVANLKEMAGYCKRIYDDGRKLSDNEYAYDVVENNGSSIVIIRGTDNARNVLTDLEAIPEYDTELSLTVHRGFWNAALVIKNDLLANYILPKNIVFTGHSMGGAIAQLLGLWFQNKGHKVTIYTFASPAVTVDLISQDNHYRVYMKKDPVPLLPPYPFIHWGIQINAETLDWDESHPTLDISQSDPRDHSIIEYLSFLNKH